MAIRGLIVGGLRRRCGRVHVAALLGAAVLSPASVPAQACSWFFDSSGSSPGPTLDDSCLQVGLPFNFPFAGAPFNVVGIGSNGFLTFGQCDTQYIPVASGDTRRRIAVYWADWAPNLATPGNGIFYRSSSTQFSVIFRNVPAYGGGAGMLNAEVVLQPSGEINLYYHPSMTQPSGQGLVGINNGLGIGGSLVDLSTYPTIVNANGKEFFNATSLPFDLSSLRMSASGLTYTLAGVAMPPCGPPASATSYGTGCYSPPLTLATNAPVLGSTWHFTTSNIDPVSPISVAFVGTQRVDPGLGLAFLGAPGCTSYITPILTTLTGVNSGGSSLVGVAVPGTASLAGSIFTAQAVCLTLANPLSLLTSNGVECRIGI